ncbi:MAG TPA: hypothetical protein VIU93_12195 [Gallionellaceae bacterium]
MKREIEREVRLPAFDLGIGDLELLWVRMTELFDSSEKIQAVISLSFPSEKLPFDSIEELKNYGQLRGRVSEFKLKLSQKNRSISLASGSLFSNVSTLTVEADSDVWCAGAIEAAMRVIRQNKVWFSLLTRVPFTLIFAFLAFAPLAKVWPFSEFPNIPLPAFLSWIVMAVMFGFFSFNKKKLLPTATITFTQELGFIRRYGSELGLALGLLALLLSIYMWMFPYGG